MQAELKCPWCEAIIAPIAGRYTGTYGTLMEKRCPRCHNLVATRLEGIPETIIKKQPEERID